MTAPILTWSVRPKHLACARPGCGREPLCGFLDEAGETFYCAVCYCDGADEYFRRGQGPTHVLPYFRTPEERRRILEPPK